MGITTALDSALMAVLTGEATAASLESNVLEFKEDDRNVEATLRQLVETALCLANAEGGTIVLGVADKIAGRAAFTGTDLDPDHVKRRVYDLTVPNLLVDVSEHAHAGQRLLVLRVPQSVEIHADTQGRAPARVGTDCVPMTPGQQATLRDARQGIDWSAARSTAGLQDVSPRALDRARELLVNSVDATRRAYGRLDGRDMLAALGVLEPDGTLLRAGAILFTDFRTGPAEHILYQHRSTPGGEPRIVERLNGPLLLAYDRVMDLVSARRETTPLTLPDGQQLQLQDFPELAVREALTNAVMHRDHRIPAAVHIDHSPTSFSVVSPGPLVPGVTLSNILTHRSKPRNPALASAVRMLGLAEEVGRGVDRMYREMIRTGRGLPRLTADFDHVGVELMGTAPDTHVARYVATLPAEEREDTDAMLVLFHLLQHRNVTADAIASTLQRDPEQAELVLRRLEAEPVVLLEPTRQTAGRRRPSYRLREAALRQLGPAVTYRRRTTDEIDRKVVSHVSEYGRVTNRTLQNMLDMNVHRAKDVLADLVARQVLVKTSQAQRGPTVEYGPGPKFPATKRRGARTPGPDVGGTTTAMPGGATPLW